MKTFFSTILIAFLLINTALTAQTELSSVDSLSQKLFRTSNRYNEAGIIYRVVKMEVLNAYFKDIKVIDQDQINQIAASAAKITSLEADIVNQQGAYDKLNAKYEHSVKVNDAMEIFSLLIPKKQYNLIMWSLVCVLVGGIIIFYLLFNRGHQATRLAKKELEEKIDEFDSYRKRTLKREQEVASGYLRDIKKLKEQLGSF